MNFFFFCCKLLFNNGDPGFFITEKTRKTMHSPRPHQCKPLYTTIILTILLILLLFNLWSGVEPESALLLQDPKLHDPKIKKLSSKECASFSSKSIVQRAQLADGCYHVFLDIGANLGVHSQFLFEPEKYPDAKFARRIFDEDFGIRRDNRDICVFAFEPILSTKIVLRSSRVPIATWGGC